jgi:hypothetical protein
MSHSAMKPLNLIPAKRAALAATAVQAAGILGLLPWCLIAQPSSNAPPTGAEHPPLPEA